MTPTQAFKTLKLDKEASTNEIRKAYAALLKITRPEDDAESFQALKEARDLALDYAKNPSHYLDEDEDEEYEYEADYSFTPVAQEETALDKKLKYLLFLPNPFIKKQEWEELADEFSKLSFYEAGTAENRLLSQLSTYLRQTSQNNQYHNIAQVAECLLPMAQLLNWLEGNTKLYQYFNGDYVDSLVSHMRSNLPLNSSQLQSLMTRNKWKFPRFSPLLFPSLGEFMKPDYLRSYFDSYRKNSWNIGGSLWAFMFFPLWAIANKLYLSLLIWAVTLLAAANIGAGYVVIALIAHFIIMVFFLDMLLIYDYSLKFEKFASKLDTSSKITPKLLVRRTLKLSPALNKIEAGSWIGKLLKPKYLDIIFSWKFVVILTILVTLAKLALQENRQPPPPTPKVSNTQSFDDRQSLFYQNNNALTKMNQLMTNKDIPPHAKLQRFDYVIASNSYISKARVILENEKIKPHNAKKSEQEILIGFRYRSDLQVVELQIYESFIRQFEFSDYKLLRDKPFTSLNEAEFALVMKIYSDRNFQEAKQKMRNMNKIEQEMSFYIHNRMNLSLFITEQGEEGFCAFLVDKMISETREFYPKYEVDAAFIRAMRMQPDALIERVLRKKGIMQ